MYSLPTISFTFERGFLGIFCVSEHSPAFQTYQADMFGMPMNVLSAHPMLPDSRPEHWQSLEKGEQLKRLSLLLLQSSLLPRCCL